MGGWVGGWLGGWVGGWGVCVVSVCVCVYVCVCICVSRSVFVCVSLSWVVFCVSVHFCFQSSIVKLDSVALGVCHAGLCWPTGKVTLSGTELRSCARI